jgi:3',5'-cyclic AMP phosphodiesterase CpdA
MKARDASSGTHQASSSGPARAQSASTEVVPIARPLALPPFHGRIWHFSDLHFPPAGGPGAADQKRRATIARPTEFDDDALRHIVAYTRTLPADALIFSGDFVDASALASFAKERSLSPTEVSALRKRVFARVRGFIQRIVDAHRDAGETIPAVVVCPGNHDVDRVVAAIDPAQSRQDFDQAFGSGVLRPSQAFPWIDIPGKGLRILVLDTAWLGGTAIGTEAQQSIEDLSVFSLEQIESVLGRMRESVLSTRERVEVTGQAVSFTLPPGCLGLVVAHHPPGTTASATVEVTAYETAIAAEQAKVRLHEAGFRMFLHGHKHVGVGQHQRIQRVGSTDAIDTIVIGAAPMLPHGAPPGFHVIDYAVARDGGEARVAVQPMTLNANLEPSRSGDAWVMSLPARGSAPSQLIRMDEHITEYGDSRTDLFFSGIPVPPPPPIHRRVPVTDTGGWTRQGSAWTRTFLRLVEAPGSQTRRPDIKGLNGVLAEPTSVSDLSDREGIRNWSIKLTVPDTLRGDGGSPGEERRVSFIERTVTTNAYSISESHQRRIWGTPHALIDLQPGWEGVSHVVRTATERLDVRLFLPLPGDEPSEVTVEPYVEVQDGQTRHIRQAPEFAVFTRPRIDRAPFLGQVHISIPHPLSGVAYTIKWKLPASDPWTPAPEVRATPAYRTVVGDADTLRRRLVEAKAGAPRKALLRVFSSLFEEWARTLQQFGAADAQDELEWTLFTPTTPLGENPVADGPRSDVTDAVGTPVLVPVVASFRPSDPRWRRTWLPGSGLAGRSYAINEVLTYLGPASGRYEATSPDPWQAQRVEIYEHQLDWDRHSVLYALPVRVPFPADMKLSPLVVGCLCVGTYRERPTLNLDPKAGGSGDPRAYLLDQATRALAQLRQAI